MKTPAGKECPQYYQDFHRGRAIQTCRMQERNPKSAAWHPADCAKCPIPEILRANASPNMRLTLTIHAGIFGIGRRLDVTAFCEKHDLEITDPYVGCPRCNAERPGFDAFANVLDELE
jgi:hypothetical protein